MNDVEGRDDLADLRRQVYARDADPNRETIERLRALTVAPGPSQLVAEEPPSASMKPPAEDFSRVAVHASERRPEVATARFRYLTLAAGALTIGVVVGLATAALGDATASVEPRESGEAAAPAGGEDAARPAYDRFAAPQTRQDVFPGTPPVPILADTTRQLFGLGGIVDNGNDLVYAGLTSGGKPCLLAVTPSGEIVAVCVSEEEFDAEGLQLQWTSTADRTVTGEGVSTDRTLFTVEWRADGSGSYEGRPAPAITPSEAVG